MGQRDAELRQLGARSLALAVSTTFAQQAFAASLGVDYPLLSDWEREVCSAYGVRYDVWKGHSGLAKRSLFLVDRTRTVRYRWSTDDAMVIPELDPVLDVLRSLGAGSGGAG